MNNKRILITAVVVLVFGSVVYGQPWAGSGDANDPYQIWTAEDMQAIGADANYWDAHFKLMADIDLSAYTGTSFNIIGICVEYNDPNNKPFTGVFDGNGHTISNFTYDSNDVDYVGLFGCIDDPNAEVKNLGLIDPNVNDVMGYAASSLVGYLDRGTIMNCYVEGGYVRGGSCGGLVGLNWVGGYITNCYSTASVEGLWGGAGGLVGENADGDISDSYSTGNVTGDGGVGGLVGGNNYGDIQGCYSTGSVTGDDEIGGLIGNNHNGNISNCYSTGSVTGDYFVGGLVGSDRHDSIISDCYSTGSVTGSGYLVGGLVGENSGGSILNCYSEGGVTGVDRVGGLVGEYSGSYDAYIINCYSSGSVSGTSNVGGLIGYDADGDYSASFWDSDVNPDVNGIGNTTDTDVTGLPTVEMQDAFTFSAWVCDESWTIDDGNDYPRLAWENKPGELLKDILYGGGSGTESEPYLIYTAKQLNVIGSAECNWDKHFKLTGDIDLSGYTGTSFNVIGYYTGDYYSSDNRPFTGVFDGGGHTISNFTYDSNGVNYIGLFVFTRGGEIKNVGMVDPNVQGGDGWCTGSLVGFSGDPTTINCCYVEGGSVSGYGTVGGLVGAKVCGGILNCYSSTSVSGYQNVGGLAGAVGGTPGCGGGCSGSRTITNCYSTGPVTGDIWVGGLLGSCYESRAIIACFWDSDVNPDINGIGEYWVDPNAVTGLPTEQLQDAFTFAAWSCNMVFVPNDPEPIEIDWVAGDWTIDDGNDYPRLWWEDRAGEAIGGELFFEGTGEANEPYLIETAEQFNVIGLIPCESDRHFKLAADIDMSDYTDESFNIIGYLADPYHSSSYENRPFMGVFDGNGHTITNFTYNDSTLSYYDDGDDYIGLFGDIDDPNAEVKNLGLINPDVNSKFGDYVGSLVGYLGHGRISGCYVQGGSVSGVYYVGGLVGRTSDSISNCYSTADVTGSSSVGGLSGINRGGEVSSCYSTGSVSGENYTGGLVGSNGGDISNCYSTGGVVADSNVGGFIGSNWWSGNIINCCSTGGVAGSSNVGGFVGYHYNFYGDYIASFWDSDVNPDVNGIGNADEPNVVGLPTVLMQTESTFTDAGWDFVGETANGTEDIWKMNCEGMSYPKLSWWEPALGDFICPDGVNMLDFAILGDAWFSDPNMANWDPACDISEPSDNFIDALDLDVFTDNYLSGL